MKVLVLCGGSSAERVVSWASGDAVGGWIAEAGHDIVKYDPEQPNRLLGPTELFAPPEIGVSAPPPRNERGYHPQVVRDLLTQFDRFQPDIVVPIFHSGYGEDGTLQALLEWMHMPFTGSGSVACALAMDKHLAKVVMESEGVPVLPGFVVERRWLDKYSSEIDEQIREMLEYPVVVKPLKGGSTVGLTKVQSSDELARALELVEEQSDDAIIESLFVGREITVTVIEDEAYPVIEIRPKAGFYDYTNKYTSGRTEYLCPAPIDEEVAVEVQNAALAAFESLGCSGFARVDFLLGEDNSFVCLEVNTLPGMTRNSLVPKAARAKGLEPVQLMEKIIACAQNKFTRAA